MVLHRQREALVNSGTMFSDPLFALARVVVGVGIVLTVIFGSVNGISQAEANRDTGFIWDR